MSSSQQSLAKHSNQLPYVGDVAKSASISCQNSNNGPASRTGNSQQRAKVTVQRRANTNQKVVSLSFDHAVELSNRIGDAFPAAQVSYSDNIDIIKCQDKCDRCSFQAEKNSASGCCESDDDQVQQKNMSEVFFVNPCKEPLKNRQDPLLVEEADEPEVSNPTPRDEKSESRPTTCLRQAWASPTIGSRQAKPCVKTTGTSVSNTQFRNSKKARLEDTAKRFKSNDDSSQPRTEGVSSCTIDAIDVGGKDQTLGSEKRASMQDDHVRNASKESFHGEIESNTPEGEVANKQGQKGKNKSRKPKNSVFSANLRSTAVMSVANSKAQDKGDGNHIRTDEVSEAPQTSEPVNKTTSRENESVTQKKDTAKNEVSDKSSKRRLKFASFFSFRKRSPLKEKRELHTKSKSQLHVHVEKPTEGNLARTSMASDILHTQGRVAMPQSITEIFAASKPKNSE